MSGSNEGKENEYVQQKEFENFKHSVDIRFERVENEISLLSHNVNLLADTAQGYMKKHDEYLKFIQNLLSKQLNNQNQVYKKVVFWALGVLGMGGILGILYYIVTRI